MRASDFNKEQREYLGELVIASIGLGFAIGLFISFVLYVIIRHV